MKNTIRPSVAIVTGACILFAVAMLWRQFHGSGTEPTAPPPRSLAHRPDSMISERGRGRSPHDSGWIAEQDDVGEPPAVGGGRIPPRAPADRRTGGAAGTKASDGTGEAGSGADSARRMAEVQSGAGSGAK